MSVNWVMLAPASSSKHPFTPLQNERVLFTSPPRVALQITTPTSASASATATSSPTTLNSPAGSLYLTNRRIVYLPEQPTDAFKSFAAPISNLHDTHVTSPFFGPNAIMALLKPVSGGGITPPSSGVVELKLTFKDGGAFDFQTNLERVKERLQQAMETSRLSNPGTSQRGGAGGRMSEAEVSAAVDLDELPAYEERSSGPLLSPVMASSLASVRHDTSSDTPVPGVSSARNPVEPPPGYEEVQRQSLETEGANQRHHGAI